MSHEATAFRPFTRMLWRRGWRGLVASNKNSYRGQIGSVVYRSPGVSVNFRLAGVTRDSVGSLLGACRVELYLTGTDASIAETISDASGNYFFDMPGTGPFYLVAYKAGSPDVAGTTVNTLTAVAV